MCQERTKIICYAIVWWHFFKNQFYNILLFLPVHFFFRSRNVAACPTTRLWASRSCRRPPPPYPLLPTHPPPSPPRPTPPSRPRAAAAVIRRSRNRLASTALCRPAAAARATALAVARAPCRAPRTGSLTTSTTTTLTDCSGKCSRCMYRGTKQPCREILPRDNEICQRNNVHIYIHWL